MFALLLLAAAAKFDPTIADDKIVMLCDPEQYRLSVRVGADAASVDHSYPERRLIDPSDLIFPLPDARGEIDFHGFLVRYERCGPYTVRLEGDAYNINAQGEAGAYDTFATVSVIWAGGLIYPKDGEITRLVLCDRSIPRANGCKASYAVRVDGWYDAGAKVTRFDEYTETEDGDTDAPVRRTVQHYKADTDQLPEYWHLSDAPGR